MPADDIDVDWAYEQLPEFPNDVVPQFQRGQVVNTQRSLTLWRSLSDAQKPDNMGQQSKKRGALWTIRDRGYYSDMDGDLPFTPESECVFLYELRDETGKCFWTFEYYLLKADPDTER